MYYRESGVRGECVIVIKGRDPLELQQIKQQSWESVPLKEHMNQYTSQGLDRKEAMKKVARDRGVGKREIYQQLLEEGI